MTTIYTINPYVLSHAPNWCNAMAINLQSFGVTPRLEDPEHWKDWAYAVIQMPGIAKLQPPDPTNFTEWRDWAARFNSIFQ